jgi:NRPS condensation-like uncharacterized protein
MQQRLWFSRGLQPGTSAYHLHWLLRLRGPLDLRALQAAIDAVVARHEVLRTVFAERAGVPGQLIAPSLQVPVEVLDAGDPAALAARPFDLASGPLVRVTLLGDDPQDHRLLIVIHHLVADGWSWHLAGYPQPTTPRAGQRNPAHLPCSTRTTHCGSRTPSRTAASRSR